MRGAPWRASRLPPPRARARIRPPLEKPGAPRLDEATAAQVRELLTKGAMGGSLFFTTDDCRKTYEALLAKGVEFTDEPTEREYGIDCGLRDPFGNSIRFSQPLTAP